MLSRGPVAGLASKHGVAVRWVDDEQGNHTDRLRLPFVDEHVTVDLIVPASAEASTSTSTTTAAPVTAEVIELELPRHAGRVIAAPLWLPCVALHQVCA